MINGSLLMSLPIIKRWFWSKIFSPKKVLFGTLWNKKLSYCWETVRRESMPRIAEMDVEMTT